MNIEISFKGNFTKKSIMKILKIVFNGLILLYFLLMTVAIIGVIVDEIKYFVEIQYVGAINNIILSIIYIISMWSTYLNCWINNKYIKIISLSTIIFGLFSEIFICEDLVNSLNWISFLYLPIIVVLVYCLIKNNRKSEV